MHKTLDVIAHGRDRFENGGIVAKRDVLLALGSRPTLYAGAVEIEAYDWLMPIEDGLPGLKAEYEKVRTSNYGSLEEDNAAIAGIKTQWLGRKYLFQTLFYLNPVMPELPIRPWTNRLYPP